MALRLLELIVDTEDEDTLRGCLPDEPHLVTRESLDGDRVQLRVVLESGAVEEVVEKIEECLDERYQGLIHGLRATLPRPDPEEEEEEKDELSPEAKERDRVNIDELVAEVETALNPDVSYIAWNILASVIACLGLIRDNVAIVIGGMIVAPLLSPSVGLAVATTLGDLRLARRAAWTSLVGLGAALATAALMGFAADFDPEVRQITLRTHLDFGDFLLAGSAGVIAVLATVAERTLAQVGAMVAVALLPPLATAGLLVGVGDWRPAGSALLLLAVNIVGINLAGVVTLLILRVLPRETDDSEHRASLVVAITSWIVLAGALAFGVHFLQESAAG